jgi:hypothetical protein
MFAEQQKIRQAKENEKEGIKNDFSDSRRNSTEGRGDPSARGRGGGGRYHYRDRDHGENYKDLEMNSNDNNEQSRINNVTVNRRGNVEAAPTTVSDIRSFSDQEESNYDSAHTYDSLSSDSDTAPSAVIAAFKNIKEGSWNGNISIDENEVTKKKKARSPSFGSTTAGNVVSANSSGNSNGNIISSNNQEKSSYPISIAERMLKNAPNSTKSAKNHASLHHLPAPVPVRASLLSRVMDYEANTKFELPEKLVTPAVLTAKRHNPLLPISPKRSLPLLATGKFQS